MVFDKKALGFYLHLLPKHLTLLRSIFCARNPEWYESGGLVAAAATEKTAGVARDLLASEGDVFKDALLHGVVVGIEDGDGEFRQYVFLSMRQVRMSNGAAY